MAADAKSRSILPEWTFGEAESSSHGNTLQIAERLGLTVDFVVIYCDWGRSGRGRPRSPPRQATPFSWGLSV